MKMGSAFQSTGDYMAQILFAKQLNDVNFGSFGYNFTRQHATDYTARYRIWAEHLKEKFGTFGNFINFLADLQGIVVLKDDSVMIDFFITATADMFTVDMVVAGMDVSKYVPENNVWTLVR